MALDNLKRRGSELNLPRLHAAGVEFMHGDVRQGGDLDAVGPFDAIVECSAEPSALAGVDGRTAYVVDSNLGGAYECFEAARRHGAQVVFLSTSRVYPYRRLCDAGLREEATRLALTDDQDAPGLSARGVSELLPLDGPRTLYGATKLAAEILLAEYGGTDGVQQISKQGVSL